MFKYLLAGYEQLKFAYITLSFKQTQIPSTNKAANIGVDITIHLEINKYCENARGVYV